MGRSDELEEFLVGIILSRSRDSACVVAPSEFLTSDSLLCTFPTATCMNEFPGCADSPTTLLDFDLFRQAQTPPLLPVPPSTSPCKAASQVCEVLTPEGGRRVSSISPSLASQKTAYPYTFSFPGFAAISLLGRRSTALANKMSLHVRSPSTSAHQMATNTSAQELCLLPENSMEPHSTAWQPAQPSFEDRESRGV